MSGIEDFKRKTAALQDLQKISLMEIESWRTDSDTRKYIVKLFVSGMGGGDYPKVFPESEWFEKALKKVWPQILTEMARIGTLDVLENKGIAAKEASDFLCVIGNPA